MLFTAELLSAAPVLSFGKTIIEWLLRSPAWPKGNLREPAPLFVLVYLILKTHQHCNEFSVKVGHEYLHRGEPS
jgi:hypothetical protein